MGNLCLQYMPVETPTLSCQATPMLLLRTQIRCRLQRCQVFQLCTFLHLIQGISPMRCMKQQPNCQQSQFMRGKLGFWPKICGLKEAFYVLTQAMPAFSGGCLLVAAEHSWRNCHQLLVATSLLQYKTTQAREEPVRPGEIISIYLTSTNYCIIMLNQLPKCWCEEGRGLWHHFGIPLGLPLNVSHQEQGLEHIQNQIVPLHF